MSMNNQYDSSWDEDNDDLWDKKFEEWENRAWSSWLTERLSFPFEVERMEDFESNPFQDNDDKAFSVGHIVKVIEIEMEDESHGIILKVREGRKTGYIPLCDVEVNSRKDKNYWPVKEYVVWFANR